ncbi:MAG TPA: hypothetical protein VEO91_13545 [Candidatus Limnocylindria bacterium]|nr:hypothetical protein [Candidatus Limnocylindria bacterium]
MRTFLTVPMAGLLVLAVAAPVAAGPNVGNYSSSVTIAQADWGSFDKEAGSYSYGYLAVSQEQGSSDALAEFNQYIEQNVQCTGAETPDDPSDDMFGTISTNRWGFGSATLSVDGKLASATASSVLYVEQDRFDSCTGESSYDELPALEIALDLTATSGTIRESGRGSFHLPGEFNSHSSYKATYRMAEGSIDGVEGAESVFGQIGKVSWSEHTNG